MKKIIGIALVCYLLLIPLAAADFPESHGYRWTMDMQDEEMDNLTVWQSIERSDMEGGASEMLFVKYSGMRNSTHVFDFFGGNLVDFRMSIKGVNSSGAERELDYSLFSDIDYSGRILVKEVTYYPPSGGSYRYYGIKEMYLNVSGTINLSMRDFRGEGEWTYEMEKGLNISILDFHTSFSPYLPFYPAEVGDWYMFEQIGMNYSGLRKGYMHYKARYPDGKKDSLDAYVGKHISGHDGFRIYSVFYSNGTMFSPSLIGLSEIIDLTPYEGYLRDFENSAFSSGFWQRYNSTGIVQIAQSSPTGMMLWSENATEDEVRDYLENKYSYTPLPEGRNAIKEGMNIWILIGTLAVLIAVSALFIAFIKRKNG